MNLDQIRRTAITALFSDDVLVEKLVLKGGNALRLVYGIGSRSSMDIDLSINKDFDDIEDVRKRLQRAMTTRFEAAGYIAFDMAFSEKPSVPLPDSPANWGGYELVFKLIERDKHATLKGHLRSIQRDATVIGPESKRVFSIDFSKHEFVDNSVEVEWDDGFVIHVYTLPMIAVEKLRAICQQMNAYRYRRKRTPRPRDFYDIFMIIEEGKVDLLVAENRALVAPIFAAKGVSLNLFSRIGEEREFHREDWPRVQATVSGVLQPFDFYFDYVVNLTERLKIAGIE